MKHAGTQSDVSALTIIAMTSVLALYWGGGELDLGLFTNLKPFAFLVSFLLRLCNLDLHQFSTSKMVNRKSVAAANEPRGRGASDDKGRKPN